MRAIFFYLLIGVLLPVASVAFPSKVPPFKATYEVKYHNMPAAKSTQIFEFEHKNFYRITTKTDSTIPYVLNIFESSRGQWTKTGPKPEEYLYRYRVFGKTRNVVSRFDWKQHKHFTQKDKQFYSVDIPEQAQDKASFQLALREDLIAGKKVFTYHVADRGRVASYEFKVIGQEFMETPWGEIQTLRVERVNVGPKAQKAVFWLAPKYDYILMKIVGLEDDTAIAEANLHSYEIFD